MPVQRQILQAMPSDVVIWVIEGCILFCCLLGILWLLSRGHDQ